MCFFDDARLQAIITIFLLMAVRDVSFSLSPSVFFFFFFRARPPKKGEENVFVIVSFFSHSEITDGKLAREWRLSGGSQQRLPRANRHPGGLEL
jgi:phosphatidylglycerophosphate synthase